MTLATSMIGSSGTVVVTGVSSGIGAAIAKRLVEAGYFVFGSVRSERDAQMLMDTLGTNFRPLVFDIRDKDAVERAAKTVGIASGGNPIAALVNNAGFAAFGPMECLDDQLFEESLHVNIIGTRFVTNAFLPTLRSPSGQSPGKIINISSLSGILNTPITGAYCVAKHALESLAEVYRRELLLDGIEVVSVRSGPVRSEIWEQSKTENHTYAHLPYQMMVRKTWALITSAESGAIPPDNIALAIEKILSRSRNRPTYYYGRGALCARVLTKMPTRWLDQVIARVLLNQTSH